METISKLNRELTDKELQGIACSIYLKMHDNYQQYGERFSMVDLKGIYETVKKGYERGSLIVFTDKTDRLIGIIMFDVIRTWWCKENILFEEIVLCLVDDYKGFGRVAVEELEHIAEFYNCGLISAGSLLSPKNHKSIENLYMIKGGFTEKYSSYLKVR